METSEFIGQFETNYIEKEEFEEELLKLFCIKNFSFDGVGDKFQKCWYLCQKVEKGFDVVLQ